MVKDECGRGPLGPIREDEDDCLLGNMYGPLDTRRDGFFWVAKTVGTFSSMGLVTKDVVEPGSNPFLLLLCPGSFNDCIEGDLDVPFPTPGLGRRSGSEKDLWVATGLTAMPTPPLLALTDGGSISGGGTSTTATLGSIFFSASGIDVASCVGNSWSFPSMASGSSQIGISATLMCFAHSFVR